MEIPWEGENGIKAAMYEMDEGFAPSLIDQGELIDAEVVEELPDGTCTLRVQLAFHVTWTPKEETDPELTLTEEADAHMDPNN